MSRGSSFISPLSRPGFGILKENPVQPWPITSDSIAEQSIFMNELQCNQLHSLSQGPAKKGQIATIHHNPNNAGTDQCSWLMLSMNAGEGTNQAPSHILQP
ncbi:hypothetical protein O181_107457 [Austropuccinia psidii MF-1]|uniref:Uncharacterized protein n=1 Tax=Austropuccinia psidii MF-1 TaxID=1389203 RepID=A0A9Q3PPD9_9BASI|nr:hypothetical protein [Austropuccinia psidii MF-1]